MANGNDDPRIYQALALPEQALENGGLEILRLGIVDDELYVSALPAFKAPAQWGEVLAEVARRLWRIYARSSRPEQEGRTIAIAKPSSPTSAPAGWREPRSAANPRKTAQKNRKKKR